jgi:hypothetical protein
MTELRNAVFIRHVVHHQNTAASNYKKLTPAKLSRALRYAGREGEFEQRGGVDRIPTREDVRLEEFKQELTEKLAYVERSGKYENRNEEKPLAEGEVSGGMLWGPRGLVCTDKFVQDVMDSQSNVVESIITISREWASDLGLTTKADFQTLLRANWTSFAEAWGVIPKGCVDWCAEFHTDADMSVHCHVHTFDRSGSFTGAEQIPHDVIEVSKQDIRCAVFAGYQHDRNVVKDISRSLCINQLRKELGLPVAKSTELDVYRKALEAGIDLGLAPRDLARATELERELSKIAQLLPETGRGRLGAYSVNKDARAAAFALLEKLKVTNPVVKEAYLNYERAVEIGAEILGKTGEYRERYIQEQMNDLEKRCANVVLKAAGTMNSPWERDTPVRATYIQVLNIAKQAMSCELAQESATDKSLATHVMENAQVKTAFQEFKDKLVVWERQVGGKTLLPEQEERLVARAHASLVKDIERAAARKIGYVERTKLRAEGKSAVLLSVSSLLRKKEGLEISGEIKREFEQAYADVKKELAGRGKVSTRTLSQAARVVLSVPEVSASITKAITFEVAKTGKEISKVEPAIQRERLAQAQAAILTSAQIERKHQQYMTASKWNVLTTIASSLIGNSHNQAHIRAHAATRSRIASHALETTKTNERKLGN